jgi:quinol monooxygenase YgiN
VLLRREQLVDAVERDQHVAAHHDLVSRARESDGCIHVAITADSVDPERINSVEVWRDTDALNAWRKQANAPDLMEPKHMEVKRYDATHGGPLF